MMPLFSPAPGKWKGSDPKIEEGDKWRVKLEKQCKTEEDESQPSINLDLGIGGPSTSSSEHHLRVKNKPYTTGRSVKVEQHDHDDDQEEEREREKQRRRKCSVVCFTEEQLEEFKAQLVIFKYMVYGLPVPLQLLLPIWRCFPSSCSPLYCHLLSRRDPFLLGLSSCGFNNIYLMDPEPGRCRRTDGKKWRCRIAVVPNQKYCEKHMHRWVKRSRKLVEGSTQPNLSPRTPSILNTNPKNVPSDKLKVKFPANLDQQPQLPTHNNSAKINENDQQKSSGKHNSVINNRVAVIGLSSGSGFSSKIAIQRGPKCLQVENLNNDLNAEPGRCRRTDGKKWRCYRSVLPDAKYCVNHIDRSKRRAVLATSSASDAASDVKFSGQEQAKATIGEHLNASSNDPIHGTPEDIVVQNGESSSTSETTMSNDDSADISDLIALSP